MSAFAETRSPRFEKDLARLRKKHRALGADLERFLGAFLADPTAAADPIQGHGGRAWKARMGIPSAGIGKSGGLRLIYLLDIPARLVVFLMAFSKAEREDGSGAEIERAKREIGPWLEAELGRRGLPPNLFKR